jgi:hypothetical protein
VRSKAQYLQNLASAVMDLPQLGHCGFTGAAHEEQKIASPSTDAEHFGQVYDMVTFRFSSSFVQANEDATGHLVMNSRLRESCGSLA